MLKAKILGWLGRRGIRIVTRNDPGFDLIPRNLEAEFLPVHEACAPYTCTSVENQYALWRAVRYVVRANVPGDFVECGVYKGGSVIVAAMAFEELKDASRKFYLYDTFAGMTAPTPRDVDFAGRTPEAHLKTWGASRTGEMANSALDEVRRNVLASGVAAERFVFVKGRVEETLPGRMPAGAISILRLDTDWYESTRHELEHLFPRLSRGGVLIVDDYGFWRGAREACDEYFREHGVEMLLNRVDRLGAVIGVKG